MGKQLVKPKKLVGCGYRKTNMPDSYDKNQRKGMTESVEYLKKNPNAHNFKTYLKMTSKAPVRNIKVGRKRSDGTRMATWEMYAPHSPYSRDGWVDASASYLTDLGYPDGW